MAVRASVTAKRLMDACETLLCEAVGLEELTARRIAVKAQATPSAIAYHFGSQEELITSVAERVYRRLNAERLALLQKAVDRRAPARRTWMRSSPPWSALRSAGPPIPVQATRCLPISHPWRMHIVMGRGIIGGS